MKSICLFAAYFSGDSIPYYVTIYLKELKKQFGEVLFLSSTKSLSDSSTDFLNKEDIQFFSAENKGYDFGLWYLAFQKLDIETYDQIILVNDSSILFRSLDEFVNWTKASSADVKGITYSEAIYPHLQSYFLVLNKKAIRLTSDYFRKHKILNAISDVILTYEVGLSRYLQEHGLKIAAFMDNDVYTGEFSPYYHCIDYHLAKGVPMIKKKIIFSSYRKTELFTLARMDFNIDRGHYFRKIKENSKELIIDLRKLKAQKPEMNFFQKIKYNLSRHFIRAFKPLYKKIKRA